MSNQSYLATWGLQFKRLSALFVFGSMLLLSACGGGGSSTPPDNTPPPAVVLKGTAAGGFPIAGYVTVKGAGGNTAGPSPIQVDGSYSVDVSTLTAPYMVYAEGTVNGKTVKYYSTATSAGNLNITSVTDYIVRNALQGVDPDTAFGSWNDTTIGSAELQAAEQLAQQQLATVMQATSGTVSDLLTSTFSANQSGFDKVLDSVSFSYSGTSATISTTLTSGTVTTDVSTGSSTGSLGTVADMQTTLDDATAIATIFQTFNNLFATSQPSSQALAAFMAAYAAPGFLNNGQDANAFVSDLVTDPLPIGFTVTAVLAEPITVAGYTKAYAIDFTFTVPGVAETKTERHQMVYDDVNKKWLWNGNQFWLNIEFNARSEIFYPASGSPLIQSSIHAWFEDTTGYANGTQGVNSIIVTGAGLPSGGLILSYQTPNPVFQIYSANNSQLGSQEYVLTDNQLAAIPDNSVYTISLYAESAANVSTQSTPLVSYNVTIPKAAPTGLTAADFPQVVSPNDHLLSTLNLPSTVNISWSNPAQAIARYVSLSTYDANNSNEFGNDVKITDTSTAIDANSLSYTPSGGYFWINSKDAYSRDYATLWELNPGSTPPPPSLTCDTNSGQDGNGAPVTPYSFADFETIVTDCNATTPIVSADSAAILGKTMTNSQGTTFAFTSSTTGTYTETGGATATFDWIVEPSTNGLYNYVVIHLTIGGTELRATSAILAASSTAYTLKEYIERSDYSDMNRASGADGDVEVETVTVQ